MNDKLRSVALLLLTAVLGVGCTPQPSARVGMSYEERTGQPIRPFTPEPPPPPAKPLTKIEQAAKDAADKAEAERQLKASDDAWKATQAESAERESARAQCTYEVASNPMINQGGWLMQAVTENHLFALCMNAKGVYSY